MGAVDHLMRAARGSTAQMEADAAAYGVKLEPHHLAPRSYRLWAEHWPAVNLFQRMQTQWRATSGGVVGLDYGVLLQLAPIWGVVVDAGLMENFQVLEAHARDTINRQANQRR